MSKRTIEIAERYVEHGSAYAPVHYHEREVLTLGEAIIGDGRGLRTYRVGPSVISRDVAADLLIESGWIVLDRGRAQDLLY